MQLPLPFYSTASPDSSGGYGYPGTGSGLSATGLSANSAGSISAAQPMAFKSKLDAAGAFVVADSSRTAAAHLVFGAFAGCSQECDTGEQIASELSVSYH